MKQILAVSLALLIHLAFASTVSADAPVYRTSATAIAKSPVVTITPAVGDTLIMFSVSTGHATTDLAPGSVSDNNVDGQFWGYNTQSLWRRPDGKWAKMQTWVRTRTVTNTNPTQVTVVMGNPTTTIAAVVAVSGLSLLDAVSGPTCGTNTPTTKTIRLMKCNGATAYQFAAGELPKVSKSASQTAPFLATSLAVAVIANESNPTAITPPTGFTQRLSVGTTVGGKHLGLNISTQDSGFSGYQVTWGSNTPTIGNATLQEIQPLQ